MKKAFTLIELLAVISLIAIIGLISIPVVGKLISDSKEKAYNSQVTMIENSAKKWGVDHVDSFSEDIELIVQLSDLIKQGYITKTEDGKLYNPKDKDVAMNGCVKINYAIDNNQYSYKYDDECTPSSLSSILKKQYRDTNTVGLLKEGDSYYYKGTKEEVFRNFVWFEGHLWRVIEINSDNTLTMVTQQPLTAISPASTIWTTEQQYKDSYINTWLNDVFYNSISDKTKIQKQTFNIGINTNPTEITTSQYAGLLDVSQYIKAGSQNSYLDIKDFFILGNRVGNGYSTVQFEGKLSSGPIVFADGVRVVIKISDIFVNNGTGTLSDPYREKSVSTNTSNVRVGEYISVPGGNTYCGSDSRCLMRVVSKDSDSIKVILNGLFPTASAFDSSNATFSASSTINTPLVEFANSISSNYRYSGNKVFSIGVYSPIVSIPNPNIFGQDYNTVKNKTYSGNVGLPVVGEMFSGNDIDVTSRTKTFVNAEVIENSNSIAGFHLINAADDTCPVGMGMDGYLGALFNGAATLNGVRPTMFLKLGTTSDLTFTKGDGTAENPYFLGN